jgi:hypothetical protein
MWKLVTAEVITDVVFLGILAWLLVTFENPLFRVAMVVIFVGGMLRDALRTTLLIRENRQHGS